MTVLAVDLSASGLPFPSRRNRSQRGRPIGGKRRSPGRRGDAAAQRPQGQGRSGDRRDGQGASRQGGKQALQQSPCRGLQEAIGSPWPQADRVRTERLRLRYRKMPGGAGISILGFGACGTHAGQRSDRRGHARSCSATPLTRGSNTSIRPIPTPWQSERFLGRYLSSGDRQKVYIDQTPSWLVQSREDMDRYLASRWSGFRPIKSTTTSCTASTPSTAVALGLG